MKEKKTNLNTPSKAAPKRILVVEDDEELRSHMMRIFELGGYETVGAENGLIALNRLRQNACDLIVTDVLMPEMDGFALATQLEQDYPQVPVIVMSGTRSHSAKFSGPGRPNVRKFLLKPISLDVLINSVLEIF